MSRDKFREAKIRMIMKLRQVSRAAALADRKRNCAMKGVS